MSSRVDWRVDRTPTGYTGTITAELPDGRIIRARGGSRTDEPDAPAKAVLRAARLATKGLNKQGRKLARDTIKRALRTGANKGAVKAALAAAALPIPGARALAGVALLASNPKIRRVVAKAGKGAFKRLARGLGKRRRRRRGR